MELFSETVYSPIQRCKINDFGTAKYLLPNDISVSYICSQFDQIELHLFDSSLFKSIINENKSSQQQSTKKEKLKIYNP
ncbi:unnamed protein product [Rotaria sordida]|uniref:Uncharacterized protein n=1 Tax=Rotaria sordida TaxID=392033 RepID=A0A814QK67_9BILA|nr:unnamed protein product [Rotaria sordida]